MLVLIECDTAVSYVYKLLKFGLLFDYFDFEHQRDLDPVQLIHCSSFRPKAHLLYLFGRIDKKGGCITINR
jgi:hypothetical protein